MILRLLLRLRRPYLRHPRRRLSTEAPISTHSQIVRTSHREIKTCHPSSSLFPISSPNPKTLPIVVVSGTLISTLAVAGIIYKGDVSRPKSTDRFYAELEQTLEKSKSSVSRVLEQMAQTAVAASVLWKSLRSVMSSANQEMRSGFEFRVAGLLADIAAISGSRRSAIVGAGDGAVVDWLLESVGTTGKERSGTREEAARALAYLVADPGVCGTVLGRPGAVPNLLRFIFSFQPKGKKQYRHSSLDIQGLCKGRSMLVAALMDIITSNCDNVDMSSFQPLLPGNADTRDIAAALEVVEEGGMHLDDHQGDNDEDGDIGMKGIGIKVLGGTCILGFSRRDDLLESDDGHLRSTSYINRNVALQDSSGGFLESEKVSVTVPGLWDDLQREHVAVPFAAWALANWALASETNRSRIQELDRDGHAIMTALTARERTVKWHGSLVARALLDDQNLPLTVSVPSWSSSLLSTAFHASKVGDISLAQVALSAFVVSVERSNDAKKSVVDKGLHLMREIARQSERHKNLQESLARVIELLYGGDMRLSLDEAQRWSGVFLRWVFGVSSSEALRLSATTILSFILEDYGPASIPISQGWLAISLNEIIEASKTSTLKGSTPLKTDKTQIDQSNALLAAQVVNQLTTAVIKLASNQSELESDSVDNFSLADLLSLEPFSALLKNMKKNNMPKLDAADSALATLKGVKALSELCSEDAVCQNKLADFGVLCLLRRLLLSDDYENLAAIETYDASRSLEMQDRGSAYSGDRSSLDSNDPSSVRIPPTAHIRRHAARLLRILSLLPKVKKAIVADENLCKWLEDCANGRVPCCNDLKTQSNARATLLNILCSDQTDAENPTHTSPSMEGQVQGTKLHQYKDMIFLINPELPHWKCPDNNNLGMYQDSNVARPVSSSLSHRVESAVGLNSDTSSCIDTLDVESEYPLLDVVFIHGLRGGPFKSWRIADNKSSTTSKAGLVENIDQEAGKEGTCWPREWLSADFPYARLFDEAGSRARMDAFKRKKEQQTSVLSKSADEYWQEIRAVQTMHEVVLANKLKYSPEVSSLKTLGEAEAENDANMASSVPSVSDDDEPVVVGPEEIATVASLWSGIPMQQLTADERKLLVGLDEELRKRVIGQDDAVTAISRAVKRSRVGLNDPGRPIAAMLFCGPTGVGKTELTKALAATYFGSEDAMLRLDMSEYMERHTVSKLIGSPPGYVGYGEGCTLTEAVRRKPFTVILLDEIEKAHPDIFNILLQVFEDGHLTDSQGRRVSFKNTLIVMTSNVGSLAISKGRRSIGFLIEDGGESSSYAAMKALVMEELKAYFRPELLNRIDEVVVFHPLEKPQMMEILNIMLREVKGRLMSLGIGLQVSEKIMDMVCQQGYDRSYGARPLRRAVTQLIEDVISEAILGGDYKPGDTVLVDVNDSGSPFVRHIDDQPIELSDVASTL